MCEGDALWELKGGPWSWEVLPLLAGRGVFGLKEVHSWLGVGDF